MKGTGYGRCLERAIRDLYALEGMSAGTVEALSDKMRASRRKGFYREVFDKAGIAVALWHRVDRLGPIPHMWSPEYDRTCFVQDMLSPFLQLDRQKLSRNHEVDFQEWKEG